MAYAVFLALGLLGWRLHRDVPALRCPGRWLGGLALLQLATGLGNVLLGWPLAAAVLHTGGAAALAVVLTWTLCESRRASSAVAAPVPTTAAWPSADRTGATTGAATP